MKKIIKVLLVILLLLSCTTGCINEKNKDKIKDNLKQEEIKENKTMECKRTATIEEGVTLDLSYTITYNEDYVKKVYSNEKVQSSNNEYLKVYKEQVENIYSPYKNIKYYYYNVRIEGDKLISEASIDYENIDTNKLIEIDSANATLIQNGKVKVSDIKKYYNNIGVTCDN